MPGFQPLTSLFKPSPGGQDAEGKGDTVDFDAILEPLAFDDDDDAPKRGRPKSEGKKRHKESSSSRTKRSSRKSSKSPKAERTALDDLSEPDSPRKPETPGTPAPTPLYQPDQDLGESFDGLLEGLGTPAPSRTPKQCPSPPKLGSQPHDGGVSRGDKLSSRLHQSEQEDDGDDAGAASPGEPAETSLRRQEDESKRQSVESSRSHPSLDIGLSPFDEASNTVRRSQDVGFRQSSEVGSTVADETPKASVRESADKAEAEDSTMPSFLSDATPRTRQRRHLGGSRRRPKPVFEDDFFDAAKADKVIDPFAEVETRSPLLRANADSPVVRSASLESAGPSPALFSPPAAQPAVTNKEAALALSPEALSPPSIASPIGDDATESRKPPFWMSSALSAEDATSPDASATTEVRKMPPWMSSVQSTDAAPSHPTSPDASTATEPRKMPLWMSSGRSNASPTRSLPASAEARKTPLWMSPAAPTDAAAAAAPATVIGNNSDEPGKVPARTSSSAQPNDDATQIGRAPDPPGRMALAQHAHDVAPRTTDSLDVVARKAEQAIDTAVVDGLKETVAELKKQMADAAAARETAGHELREAKEAAAKAVVEREEQHRGSLEALRSVHREELESMRRRFAEADRLAQAEAKLETAVASFSNLQVHIADHAKGLDAAQDAQLEARKRLVDDMELSAREARRTSEAETVKLQAVLSGMDAALRNIRSMSAHEHERLHHEHARLSSLQESLDAQARASRESAALEWAHSRARIATQEATLAKLQDEVAADRAALQVEREELEAGRADLARRTSRIENDAALKLGVIAKKEAALLELHQRVQEQSGDLDRRVEAVRRLMLEADDREAALDKREQRLQAEMRRLLEMHGDLEQAARAVAERHAELDSAFHEAALAKADGDRSRTELAVRRADLADAQAAMAEEARRRHVENVKLLRERTELIKAKAGVHRLHKQWAAFAAPPPKLVEAPPPQLPQPPSGDGDAGSRALVAALPPHAASTPPAKIAKKKATLRTASWKAEMDRLRASAVRSQAAVKEQDTFLAEVGCV